MPTAFDGDGTVPIPTLTVGSLTGLLTGLTFTVGRVSIVAKIDFHAVETGRQTVPEPTALALVAAALAASAAFRRRA